MSKALPSTRILLKSQYIPMVEKEKAMLNRANKFLADIISKEKQIVESLTSTFFNKRYGYHQFVKGCFCIDTTKGTKDHTEKNVYAAFLLLAERHKKACSIAQGKEDRIGMNKAEVLGIEGLRNRISQTWQKQAGDRLICLPPTLTLEEALDLCDYKEMICRNNPVPQRSQNSLVLLYTHKIQYDQIQLKPDLLDKYNRAILSNVFLNIDDATIYNNRDSIFEGLVRETFGNGNDTIAKKITQSFFQN
jgi:hypothetical protein